MIEDYGVFIIIGGIIGVCVLIDAVWFAFN